MWPDSGPSLVRISFGKLKEIASIGNRHSYLIDTTAENLWGKVIPSASFSLYLFDKNKVRIGEGYISLNNVGVGETVKFQVAMDAAGTQIVEVSAGKHRLDFSKEGFNPGSFPLEIGPTDSSGGSVSYELGSSVHDTVELRDGSVISGDLESVSATDVVVRIGGKDSKYDRNQIKRILLVERESSQEPLQPAAPKQ